MSDRLRTLTVGIVANAKPLQAGLRGAMGNVRSFAAAFVGGIGVAAVGKTLIQLGSDAQEMNSKLDAVWQTSAADARKWSDTTADSIKRSQNEVRKFHSELGDLFQPMGFVRDEAFKLSSAVTMLAYDLASFNNMADSEALDRLRGTLVGSHENALKFGVVINEATLKTELLAMGAKKVNGEFTTQDKVLARLNLLLKGTTAAHGDAARTANGFANSFKGLRSQMSDLGATVGSALLPAVTAVVRGLSFFVRVLKALALDKVTASVLLFTGALGGILYYAGPIVSSLGMVKKAIDAIRTSTIIMQAFAGPKGWLALGASVAVAGIALHEVSRAFDETSQAASANYAVMKASTAGLVQQTEAQKQVAATSKELVAGLQEEVRLFGLSGRELAIRKAQMENATIAALRQADALHKQMNALEAASDAAEEFANHQKTIQTQADAIRESLKSPMDSYIEQLKTADMLVQGGALSWQDYAKAKAKAASDFLKTRDLGISSPRISQALEKGSSGAFQAIAEARGAQRMVELQEKQLQVELDQLAAMRQLVQSGGTNQEPQITVVQY